MSELYVLGTFDEHGEFVRYVRKGRNSNISGYDTYDGAKRGLSQSRSVIKVHDVKIIQITSSIVVEDE